MLIRQRNNFVDILDFVVYNQEKLEKEVMYVKCGSSGEYGELNSWKGNCMSE